MLPRKGKERYPMTKIPGQKHFQREDHEHAAHQADAARHRVPDPGQKRQPVPKGDTPLGEHPAESTPKSPHKGQ